MNADTRGKPAAKYWADPQTFATSLVALFLDAYGLEAAGWDPATIQMEVEEDNGVELPRVNFEKLMTGLALLQTNSFFVSPVDFAHFCFVLAGHSTPPGGMALPDADDVAWGITEALLLSPPEGDDEEPFAPEVTALVGEILDAEGILTPPDVLRIATRNNALVDRVQYDFSDDPTMFNAIYDMETAKTEAIDADIRGRLVALARQLKSLPLRSADRPQLDRLVDGIISRLGRED